MALSYQEYTNTGTGTNGLGQNTFSIPFKYISINDVRVRGFDGITWSDDLTITRNASAKTVTLTGSDPTTDGYTKVRLYRVTTNQALIDFQNGSRLSESDLDTAYQQSLFCAQEVSEDASTTQFNALREAANQAGTSLSNFESEEIATGLIDGTTDTFGLSINPRTTRPEAYRVAIDGVMQSPVDAYTISINPPQIVFASAPPSGSKIVVVSAASAASAVSVDNATIGLTSNNRAEVKDGGITPAKVSTGGPSWTADGNLYPTGLANVVLDNGHTDGSGLYLLSQGNSTFYIDNFQGNFRVVQDEVERIRIYNHGTVRVGLSSSQTASKLRVDNYADDFGYGIDFYGKAGSSSFRPLNFRNSSGVVVGSVYHDNSSTSYNTSSDYRLKEDIIDISDSLERLKALKPCNFAWKADGSRVDGFIAHEAQEVVPEAVTGTKDAVDDEGNPEYQGIDQSKLVPLLTKALQEALTKIETLEARVEVLENA